MIGTYAVYSPDRNRPGMNERNVHVRIVMQQARVDKGKSAHAFERMARVDSRVEGRRAR